MRHDAIGIRKANTLILVYLSVLELFNSHSRAIKPSIKYRIATDTATIAEKYNDTPVLNASLHWTAA